MRSSSADRTTMKQDYHTPHQCEYQQNKHLHVRNDTKIQTFRNIRNRIRNSERPKKALNAYYASAVPYVTLSLSAPPPPLPPVPSYPDELVAVHLWVLSDGGEHLHSRCLVRAVGDGARHLPVGERVGGVGAEGEFGPEHRLALQTGALADEQVVVVALRGGGRGQRSAVRGQVRSAVIRGQWRNGNAYWSRDSNYRF